MKKEILEQKKIETKIREIADTLKKSPKASINATDPECIKAKGPQGVHPPYKAQLAVNEKHGLIVHSEAVSQNNDLNQLHTQINQASEAQPFLTLGKGPTKQRGETAEHVLILESALPLKTEEGSSIWRKKNSRTNWKTSIKAHKGLL